MAMSPTIVKKSGLVTVELIRKGTASEHNGVVLRTPDGERWVLVRIGGNPFDDPENHSLDGKCVEVEGFERGSNFHYNSWVELP